MNIYWYLVLAHLIGDWLLQTEYQAKEKAHGRFLNAALLSHCFVYTLIFIPLFSWYDIGAVWLILIFISHVILDRRSFVGWWMRNVKRTSEATDKELPWLKIMVDQIFHLLILVPIALFG